MEALHLLMASYGWTLAESFELTYPQVKALMKALGKWPTVNLIAAGLTHGMKGKEDLSGFGAVTVDGKKLTEELKTLEGRIDGDERRHS